MINNHLFYQFFFILILWFAPLLLQKIGYERLATNRNLNPRPRIFMSQSFFSRFPSCDFFLENLNFNCVSISATESFIRICYEPKDENSWRGHDFGLFVPNTWPSCERHVSHSKNSQFAHSIGKRMKDMREM